MARQLHDETTTFAVKETDLPEVANADPEVSYTLRPLTTAKFRELVKQNTGKVPDKRSRAMVEQIDDAKVADDLIDWVIAGWSGITMKGQPAECSRENKQRLDGEIKRALIGMAGLNQITAADDERDRSFRPPA